MLVSIAINVFLMIVIFLTFYFKNKETNIVFEVSQDQFKHEINSLYTRNSQSLDQVVHDYTFWDELVKNVYQYNPVWFKENISSILESYHLQYVCVYDSSFNLIHESSKANSNPGSLPTGLLSKLKEKRFIHFYLLTKDSLLFEFSGASIHGADDPDHTKTEPSGYFLAARIWDKGFLQQLESVLGARVIALPASDSMTVASRNSISIVEYLPGWENSIVGKIYFVREEKILQLYKETSLSLLLVIISSMFVLMVVFWLLHDRWIMRPLKLIENALETENTDAIRLLRQIPGEFGKIGTLIDNYLKQEQDLIAAKELAEKSDRLKSEFLSNMSHEIRTPMNGIMGFAELINIQDLTDKERREFSSIIMNSSEQLLRIINDILEISSLETKQVKVYPEETNMEVLLQELFAVFNLKAKAKGLSLVLTNELIESQNNVILDKSKLFKILSNLLENALKFTKDGSIVLGCKKSGDDLKFFVKDTGIGIENESLNKIFDRFSQANNNIAAKFGGLGLGLSIVKENITLLGGNIEVESTPGTGSVFHLTLPYHGVEIETVDQEKAKSEIIQIYGTVLIAEDDNSNYQLLETIILKISPAIKLLRAANGEEAIEQCLSRPDIDLVFMDIKLPLIDGIEATKRIRELRPKIPIIAQTACVSATDKNAAEAAGCNDYLIKPINIKILKVVIEKYLVNDKSQINKRATAKQLN
jgi:signal transduction histidine kinase/ActR/RegA family two-component response regulator